jgi:hypothetical protein
MIDRPCQRCIKRGCADTCTDGLRKRAKYLLETTQGGMYYYTIQIV